MNNSRVQATGMDMEHAAHTLSHPGMETDAAPHSMRPDHSGHSGHMMHMGNLKQKFFVSLLLALPIVLLSPMMGVQLPFQLSFKGSQWIVLVFAVALFFYGGAPFLSGARSELAEGKPAMMTLISLGITVAFIYSLYAFVANNLTQAAVRMMDFFWELATLILIMLLGHWIEMSSTAAAGNALEKMAALLPKEVTVKKDDGTTGVLALKDVAVGQRVVVKAGERMPADGVVTAGSTTVDESLVTGESRGIAKSPGESVIGGSLNGSGTVEVRVTGTGESGYLAILGRMVDSAQQEKSKVELLSDRVAGWLFYIALVSAFAAFFAWLLMNGSLDNALLRMVTVLVIACPHALGLAVPLIAARSTSLGAKNGLLIRKRGAFERVPNVDVVMTDKTGTLTEGDFQVQMAESFSEKYDRTSILSLAASLEKGSNHPLASGIIRAAQKEGIELHESSDIENIGGVGIKGRVNDTDVMLSNPSYLDKRDKKYDEVLVNDAASKGYSVSVLLADGEPIGLIAQGDRVKESADRTISQLKAVGIRPVMLTGDNPKAASVVAGQLGIGDVHAPVLPQDKQRIVGKYQEENHVVMMVGDGVNDAPALARADVGVAIGAGTDVAVDTADIVLVRSNPEDIISLISLAKNTRRKMKENLWWGAGYNIIAIPLAAGILAPWGIVLSPAAGAVLMSLSTVIVALNAMTLKIK